MYTCGPAFFGAGGVSISDPLWANVQLALHCNGSDGSTSVVDEKGHTVTILGAPTIATAQSKFGGASLHLPGSGGVTVGGNVYNADFDFGTGDFMVRLWAWADAYGGSGSTFFDCRFDGGDATGFYWGVTSAGVPYLYSGTGFVISASSAPIATGVWTHVEVGRVGSTTYMFVNGVLVGSSSIFSAAMSDGRCFIGQATAGGGGGFFWDGYFDDVQVVKGQGLHTANFTPPAAPFPNF